MTKVTIDVHPEFSYELALAIPYANWLQQNGQLDKVITSYGMKPFYFFADNIEERYSGRTVDNGASGVNSLPNNWIHHNALAVTGRDYKDLTIDEKVAVNGVLDYSKWTPPDYRTYYRNDEFKFGDKFIVISNRYNYEHGKPPQGYFDIECLYYLFTLLTDAGYHVIYKRPENTEFPIDENERMMLGNRLSLRGTVGLLGNVTDKELASRIPNVHVLENIPSSYGYNELQLKIFANASGFISMAGGNGIFCSYFGVPNVTYVTTSGELRKGYFDEGTYYRKLSGADIYAVCDDEKDIVKRGYRNYSDLYIAIQNAFL